MLTAFAALVIAVAVLVVVILFALVVIGIRNEPHDELRRHAPGPISAMSRRMLGVYVGKPDEIPSSREEACLAGYGHATAQNKEEGDAL